MRDALQLGNDLATLLPSREAQEARKQLRELGVPVVLVRPIPHQILYDRTQIYVEAGKPVEIVFENVDIMPHNLVITRPGALQKVGLAAEKMAADPNAYARNFVPDLPEVLHATKLLQPGQTDRLNFEAPSELGDYPYVCTFPGHWQRMYGTLHVVRSLDEIPRETLLAASAPTSTAEVRPFVQAWTVQDFSGDFADLGRGRDRDHGKQLFTEMACVQCHRMKGVGGQVGPDLADLKPRLSKGEISPVDVLTSMIEPSKVIDDKYRSHVIALSNGEVVSGIIVDQNDKELKVSANPLGQTDAKPLTIPRNEIEEQVTSQVSLMPEGLLNTMTREEVLDLVSYILSGGE